MQKNENFVRSEFFCQFDINTYKHHKIQRIIKYRKQKRTEKLQINRKTAENFLDMISEFQSDKGKIEEMLRKVQIDEDCLDIEGFKIVQRYLVEEDFGEVQEMCLFLLLNWSKNGIVPYEVLKDSNIIGCIDRVLSFLELMEQGVGCYFLAIGNFCCNCSEFAADVAKTQVLGKILELAEDCSDFIMDKCYFLVSSIVYWTNDAISESLKQFLLDGLGLACLGFEATERILMCIYKKIKEFKFFNSHILHLCLFVNSEIRYLDSLALDIIAEALSFTDVDEIIDYVVLEKLYLGLKGRFKTEILTVFFNLLWNSRVFLRFLIEFQVFNTILEFLVVEKVEFVVLVLVFCIKCSEDVNLGQFLIASGVISSICILLGSKDLEILDKTLDLLYVLRIHEQWQAELIKFHGAAALENLIYSKNSIISEKSQILYDLLINNLYI